MLVQYDPNCEMLDPAARTQSFPPDDAGDNTFVRVKNVVFSNVARKPAPFPQKAAVTSAQTALRKMALLEEPDQAIPISKESFYKNLEYMSGLIKIALFLTWKSASRWDEVMQLGRSNIRRVSATEIIIRFTLTKARQQFRADHCIIVVDTADRVTEVMTMVNGRGQDVLFPWTTTQTGLLNLGVVY